MVLAASAFGAAAAALCFVLNQALFARVGYRTIIGWSPLLEEGAKTLPAYWLEADIFIVHVVFGAIEAAYDWRNGGAKGRLPALLSLMGHALFGFMTVWALPNGIYFALALGCMLHVLWNVGVVKFS